MDQHKLCPKDGIRAARERPKQYSTNITQGQTTTRQMALLYKTIDAKCTYKLMHTRDRLTWPKLLGLLDFLDEINTTACKTAK